MRSIVHLDADAFFASVEQSADTRLRGKPIAVGGESRGIIASASYEARQFGIYTPMPTARARKLCPKLIVLPGDYERYEQFSHWMFGYAYDFTPNVEQTSIDEGYFDLTANRSRPFVEIAQTIRQAIRQSLKIAGSEGIASNKLVSQIASKLHKPAAFEIVPDGGEKQFLHTPWPGTPTAPSPAWANTSANRAAESLFPVCAVNGSQDDLHLVVSEDAGPAVVRWLGPEARAALAGRTLLSLPLPLVTLDALARLEALGKLPPGSEAVRAWRQWLADDLGAEWEQFRQARAQKQAGLGLDLPGELSLG